MTKTNTLVFIAGWGLGVAPLQALATALTHELSSVLPDFVVQLQPLPDFTGQDTAAVIQQLNIELPNHCWLAGWSLGGMLATAVAAQRQNTCAGLISVASNACFVVKDTWLNAMPSSNFIAFHKRCQNNLTKGLKHFSQLCSQGATDPKVLSRELLTMALMPDLNVMLEGLNLLAKLDNRAAIAHFSSPQLHLFAADDALVPVTAAADYQILNAQAAVEVLGQSHACVLAEPQLLAQRMAEFIVSHQNA
ncbi:MAG TPA: alpha/beta fold hydrolase [Marinospirillum sp.]|uniref:alpha/beta fold hydrolase n=1 Tax=Marinospirillum sp. TaxID=2183934 RepID=UPI002B494904|nr:alpha/beta fold hydrolase [Marinospirillum sp.]HKM16167.1 alpha/beta fold hydrolase [Marinospirillum sp.]